jgi:hypothetical protein
MPPAVAALNVGVEPCWGLACSDMLEAMARITPSQPNNAMARIASRRNRTISLDPNLPGQISERFFRDFLDVNLRFRGKKPPPVTRAVRSRNFTFSLAAVSAGSPPVVRRLFEVNSEPHTGARPSVRLCVGLITRSVKDNSRKRQNRKG